MAHPTFQFICEGCGEHKQQGPAPELISLADPKTGQSVHVNACAKCAIVLKEHVEKLENEAVEKQLGKKAGLPEIIPTKAPEIKSVEPVQEKVAVSSQPEPAPIQTDALAMVLSELLETNRKILEKLDGGPQQTEIPPQQPRKRNRNRGRRR